MLALAPLPVYEVYSGFARSRPREKEWRNRKQRRKGKREDDCVVDFTPLKISEP